jgi:hypothetical protein
MKEKNNDQQQQQRDLPGHHILAKMSQNCKSDILTGVLKWSADKGLQQ